MQQSEMKMYYVGNIVITWLIVPEIEWLPFKPKSQLFWERKWRNGVR